ncbi:hypothetical protein VE01_02019 [Pseudogymnoascus verrucosus]|uniref:Protein kinase domain-containing protein n=1 Tax=Pseudogymnoascus verrucosus TaxID=342668 RepID=A0A1B8GVP3_9PEZI|nr:uncharacterized protein VE01_02019 [Pseudogymnoascus verrucosus]OBT99915.1 hypothetical protein VE01_02019 [Pseudogymnoascus verrucosus]
MAVIASELPPTQAPQVRNQPPQPPTHYPPQPLPLPPHLDPAIRATRLDVINAGSSCLIHLPSNHVRKNVYPERLDESFIDSLELESRIYQRLPKKHPRLLEMISYSRDEGLILEYMPEGDLGSYIRGEEPRTRSCLLFALGSTIYEIMTGKEPYLELKDDEVTALFEEKKFPSVVQLPCGDVMMKCWLSEVHSAEEVRALIEAKLQDCKAEVSNV